MTNSTMTEQARQEELMRLAQEYDRNTMLSREWRINHIYKIQDKKRQVILFKRNAAQKIIHALRGKFTAILKSRQHGVTTGESIECLDDVLFRPNFTAVILAHKRQVVQKIFRKIKFAFDALPEVIKLRDGRIWRKPVPQYDNVNELYFPGIGSRIYVDIEVRGDTVNREHITEAAFIKQQERILASLEALTPDGIVTLESTANGVGGYFYDVCQEALEGENEFTFIFLGWDKDPENYIEPPAGFKLTEEEEKYRDHIQKEIGITLTLGQMLWRQVKMKRLKHLFRQEQPITESEAFLFSGRSVFDQEKISDWPTMLPVATEMDGRLKVWVQPKGGSRYVIGVDVAEGISVEAPETSDKEAGSDWSVIEVLDWRTNQQVAEWRGKWPYHKLHEIIRDVGKKYNFAFVGVERNNHGLTVCANLPTVYPEDYIYTERVLDQKNNKKRKRWGWVTTGTSKPLMIDDFSEVIDEETVTIHSKQLQKECRRFIINDDGSMGAQEGYHDDTVMAMAIAQQMRKRWLGTQARSSKSSEDE